MINAPCVFTSRDGPRRRRFDDSPGVLVGDAAFDGADVLAADPLAVGAGIILASDGAIASFPQQKDETNPANY